MIRQFKNAGLLLAVLVSGVGLAMQAQEPDYSKVKDILSGRRTLLQIQDLGIGGVVAKTGPNSQIKDADVYSLAGIHPSDTGEALNALVSAHLFDLPYQVLVGEHAKLWGGHAAVADCVGSAWGRKPRCQ